MTWQPGRDRIGELLAAGELEEVAPDEAIAGRLAADAGRRLAPPRGAAGWKGAWYGVGAAGAAVFW